MRATNDRCWVVGVVIAAACVRAPTPTPGRATTPRAEAVRVAVDTPAVATPAVDAAAVTEASVPAPPATLAGHFEGLARAAIPLALGRPLAPTGLCADHERVAPEESGDARFPELREGRSVVLLATLVRVVFAAPAGCSGAACRAAVSSLGVVLPGDSLRWADLGPDPDARRLDTDLTTALDDDDDVLAPLREARDGLRSPRCAPSPRFDANDLARAFPGDPDAADLLGRYVLTGASWRPLSRARCAASRASTSWDARTAGLAVFARSGETMFRVDVRLGGRWPGCVQGTVVTVPE